MNTVEKNKIKETLKDDKLLTELANTAFDAADTNKNGKIERSELGTVMKDLAKGFGLSAPTEAQVTAKFKTLDVDKNGTISREEFKVFVKETTEKLIDTMN